MKFRRYHSIPIIETVNKPLVKIFQSNSFRENIQNVAFHVSFSPKDKHRSETFLVTSRVAFQKI